MKKELMTWDQLKQKDFESILGEFTVEFEKVKAYNKGLQESGTSLPGFRAITEYQDTVFDMFASIVRAFSIEMEMIHALKEGLWDLEITLNDLDTRLSIIEKNNRILDDNL